MTPPERWSRAHESPLGRLLLVEEAGTLVRLAWADRETHDPLARAAETPLLRLAAEQLEGYFAGSLQAFDLPLAPRGSAFQRRAWEEMARIPYGATSSYGALARRLASVPRAIGQACKSNPIPIVIPCHRVLAAGDNPGGYSGGRGLETKLALLALEGTRRWEPDLFAGA